MRDTRPLIVGAGPAGCAAAITLAQAGARPLVLERERTPADPLCGGFLSWTALPRLARLGVDVAALGARPVTALALFAGPIRAASPLPAPAASLSRGVLDAALQAQAEACGAEIRCGIHVRGADDLARLACDAAGTQAAGPVVLATGKHEMRNFPRQSPAADPVLGLRWRLALTPAMRTRLTGLIELHCFAGGYAGLSLQEDGRANLCLAMRASRFDACGKRPDGVLRALHAECPALAGRLDAALSVEDAAAVANVPYGWRAAEALGVFRVGDQAGCIASLSGEGIALALGTGIAAGEALLRGDGADAFRGRLAPGLAGPIAVAQGIKWIAEKPMAARLATGVAGAIPALSRAAAQAMRLR